MGSLVKCWLIFCAILLSYVYPNHVIAHDETWHTISAEKLAAKIEQGDDICLINVLPKIIHDNRHIPGSINIPVSEILTSPLMPKEKDKPLIFYCMGTLRLYSPKAARMASEIGYSNVCVYKKGILGWVKAGYQLDSVADYPGVKIPRISSIQLKEMSTSSMLLLDIRPLSHFLKGHIRGSVNVDLDRLHTKLDRLPNDKKIILVDHKGKLTLTTGRFLISKGFSSVSRLDGGFNAWVKNGFFAEK